MKVQLKEAWARAAEAMRPPPQIPLSDWIEQTIYLPQGLAAEPGPIRLWPWQRAICDAIASTERVTVCKSARIGYTAAMTGILANYCANEPCAVLAILPTESDARDYTVTEVENLFQASPALRGILGEPGRGENGRATICHRPFPGGSLRVISSRAPRNLRRIAAKVLLIDEVDAMECVEGDIVALAEKRTLTFSDRRIVVGSTPLLTETSTILRLYAESDQRVWELPCPECGTFSELTWAMIEWPPDHPDRAAFKCPHCEALIDESRKTEMVEAGAWRITRPEIAGHAGFRLNSLTSLLPNAAWGKLAAEFLQAKDSPSKLQVFVNTVLGQGWNDAVEEIEESDLAARAEPFGLDHIPDEVLSISVGVDCADDRLEATICGWDRLGTCFVLAHEVLWGPILDEEVWRDLDELLKTRWAHPRGGVLKVECALIDCGDGGHYDRVLGFTMPRLNRRIFASKGVAGVGRAIVTATKSRIGNRRLLIVGVDGCKQNLMTKLARGRSIRFSASLPATFYEQLASEKRLVRYSRGRPVIRFERKPGALAEALDALVLATAAHAAVRVNVEAREAELGSVTPPTPTAPRVWRSKFMEQGRL